MRTSLGGLTRGFPHPETQSPRRARALLAVVLLAPLLALMPSAATPAAPAAAPAATSCGAANEIVCENRLPGSPPSEWDIFGAGDESIQGFATQISVNRGERIDFKINTPAPAYSIKIFRTGWYGGLGARQVDTVQPSASLPQAQPNCITDQATSLYDCGNWAVSASWNVPSTAVSGVYIARLGLPGGGASHITFIVRDDASRSELLMQTSDTTWQAYNSYGGSSFYVGGGSVGRAYKLSYNRPFNTRQGSTARDFYFSAEYPLVRFLERNGYDVSYIAGVDTDRRGELLRNHETFLSVGHDEYWSGTQRANVVAARDAGVNLAFLSGNEMYWHTRYEPSADASRTPYRTLVSYKETWGNAKIDPSPEWTGTYRDPRFASQAAGAGLPENAVTGTMYMANFDDLAVTVDSREGRLRLWRNSPVADLPAGTSRALAPSTVGYESDEDIDNGFRPPGLVRLSTTVGPTTQYLQDFGNTVAPGTTTHHLTMYRAGSGALVFSAGTIQWTWGLDDRHDSPEAAPPAPDRSMQQAQVNLLADMGALPATLMEGLAPASPSGDTSGPTVTVASPTSGALPNGAVVTARGSAQDVGGGQVAGVEVSTDRGATWHPANGTTEWSYTYVQHGYGASPVWVRAIDDSANIGRFVARHPQAACPCSVFGDEEPAPAQRATTDPSASELGLRFVPRRAGRVTGVRFYKGTGNTGTHVGSLWSAGGVLLARATFGAESDTGWQSVSFANPVDVQAGQPYVVSYTAPNGHYAAKQDAFELRGVEADPLSVPGGFAGGESGVFAGALGGFPDQSFRNTNYYVDVLFSPTGPPDAAPTLGVAGLHPANGATGVPRGSTVAATFTAPLQPGASLTVSQGSTPVGGTVAATDGGRTLVFTPAAPMPASARITARVAGVTSVDGVEHAPVEWSFTTGTTVVGPGGGGGGTPGPGSGARSATLFGAKKPHGRPSDRRGVEVGVAFTPARAGWVMGIRFYQLRGRPLPRSVTLWAKDGDRLARERVSAKDVKSNRSGWRTVLLDDPVALRPGRKYVASYYLPEGRAARTSAFYRRKVWTSGPLTAKRSDNGRYVVSSKSRFPRRVDRGVNFFADVRFDYGG